jgi:hypothetical protein
VESAALGEMNCEVGKSGYSAGNVFGLVKGEATTLQ